MLSGGALSIIFRAWTRKAVGLAAVLGISILYAENTPAAWLGVGPQTKVVEDIAVAPNNPLVRFGGAFGSGVFKSVDGGTTWKAYTTGMANTYVRSLLALSSTVVYAGTNDGIFRSVDGGLTWRLVLASAFSVRSLARDPLTGRFYAGTFGDDLYRSPTGDTASWTKLVVMDIITGTSLHHLHSVAIFGRDSLYVGGSIGDVTSGGALFASYDGGTTFVQLQRGIGIRSSVEDIAISPTAPDSSLIIATAAKGVYKTTDGGVSWLAINGPTTTHPLPDLNAQCVEFTPAYRMVGTDSLGGFYRRALGDTTQGWFPATGVPGMPWYPTVAWSDAPGIEIMVGTHGMGVYQSIDSGKTFVPRNTGMLGTAVRDIVFGNAGRMIVATGFGDKIWYTDNGGTTWTQAMVPSSNSVDDISKTSVAGMLYAGCYASGVLKSTDNGQTWVLTDTTTINKFVRDVAVPPGSSTTIYAGTGNGIYKTINSGLSWTNLNGAFIPFSTSIRSLAISPASPNLILAGTDIDFVYRSADGGGTWSHVATAGGFNVKDAFIRCIEFDPTTPGRVYAGSDTGHVYMSTNDGANWSFLFGLPTVNSVRAIRVDPANASRLFAATFGGGVFVSENGGTSWTNISSNLPDLELYSLELDPAGPSANVYLGTGQTGLFKAPYNYNPNCSCPYAGDGDASGSIDVLDVVMAVEVAFNGGPSPQDPTCLRERLDFDCGGSVDVLDVVALVDFAFNGGAGPCNQCAPF